MFKNTYLVLLGYKAHIMGGAHSRGPGGGIGPHSRKISSSSYGHSNSSSEVVSSGVNSAVATWDRMMKTKPELSEQQNKSKNPKHERHHSWLGGAIVGYIQKRWSSTAAMSSKYKVASCPSNRSDDFGGGGSQHSDAAAGGGVGHQHLHHHHHQHNGGKGGGTHASHNSASFASSASNGVIRVDVASKLALNEEDEARGVRGGGGVLAPGGRADEEDGKEGEREQGEGEDSLKGLIRNSISEEGGGGGTVDIGDNIDSEKCLRACKVAPLLTCDAGSHAGGTATTRGSGFAGSRSSGSGFSGNNAVSAYDEDSGKSNNGAVAPADKTTATSLLTASDINGDVSGSGERIPGARSYHNALLRGSGSGSSGDGTVNRRHL
jgi:hypothetical protein